MNIKQKAMKSLMMGALSLALMPLYATAQQNNNTSTGQMKESGSEVGKAGKSIARHARRGRIVRGSKHFGKHMGRAGKHFGRGTKKAVKHVIS
jgi:predicted outer membrane protein